MTSVILRSAWSDDRHALQAARRGVGAAVVHHTVGAWTPGQDKLAWTRGLEHAVTQHVAPGNSTPLAALDYNELIFPDGEVVEGRGLGNEDAATYNFNAESVSWALVGNYDTHDVPAPMLEALAGRIREAIREGWLITYPKIEGHRDVGTFATACPGRFMEAHMAALRALVSTGVLPQGAPGTGEEDDMYSDDDRARDNASALRIEQLQRDLPDSVSWIGNWIKDGGYPARADGKPSRIESIETDVDKIREKLGA